MELANSGRSINDLKREYNFTEEDLEDLERMGIDQQFSLIQYGEQVPGYIGDYSPLIVMHETKKTTVKK